jgi:hypothetical protein
MEVVRRHVPVQGTPRCRSTSGPFRQPGGGGDVSYDTRELHGYWTTVGQLSSTMTLLKAVWRIPGMHQGLDNPGREPDDSWPGPPSGQLS